MSPVLLQLLSCRGFCPGICFWQGHLRSSGPGTSWRLQRTASTCSTLQTSLVNPFADLCYLLPNMHEAILLGLLQHEQHMTCACADVEWTAANLTVLLFLPAVPQAWSARRHEAAYLRCRICGRVLHKQGPVCRRQLWLRWRTPCDQHQPPCCRDCRHRLYTLCLPVNRLNCCKQLSARLRFEFSEPAYGDDNP
jgi:hypothetical protein